MQDYKTPGVYIEEIPKLPSSIASVETAIPAFIGYTQKARRKEDNDLINKPWRIKSLLDYESYFGGPPIEPKDAIEVIIEKNSNGVITFNGKIDPEKRSKCLMHYSMQMFFENGGGACYIVSVGSHATSEEQGLNVDLLKGGLREAAKENEVTLLVFPDSLNLSTFEDYYSLHKEAVDQCVELQDRFTVMDLYRTPENSDKWELDKKLMRSTFSGTTDELKYAAVYFPRIFTNVDYNYRLFGTDTYNDENIKITGINAGDVGETLAELKTKDNSLYFKARTAIRDMEMLLPAAPAVVGIYADTDNSRGVWKAPANVNIDNVTRPEIMVTNKDQEDLNVDALGGKSINVIRNFVGRGPALIWGARTLAGNDNEWRYIPVRRFFNMVEESVKNASGQFVFEINDKNTWVRVKSMIENYLTQQWKAGALMGASTKEAFFVHIGLGETMTELDVWEGRMIIEIGMAVVRPAEFIILRFMHKMVTE